MVQNIPVHAICGANSNTSQVNNAQKCDTLLRNYSQSLEQDTFTPQFTGSKEKTSNKKNILGKLLTFAAVVGGAILLKKNWNKVSQFVDDIIKKFKGGKKAATNAPAPKAKSPVAEAATNAPTSKPKKTVVKDSRQKAMEIVEKNTEKVHVPKEKPRKHRFEHTVPNKNPKPITNAREAQVVENINLSHVDANTRKMVEKAGAGTVTPAQQKAYDKAIAYQAPTAAQKTAMAERHAANAAQRAELNSIANNSTGAEKLVAAKAAAQAEAQAAKVVTSGPIRHANGNIYHVENGAITKVELFQRNKAGELVKNTVELTDPTKIAKHMAKQGVSMSDLIAKESVKVAA